MHHVRIVTYVDVKEARAKQISLQTNDMEMGSGEIVEILTIGTLSL